MTTIEPLHSYAPWDEILFHLDNIPFKVIAVSNRYAVCTRKIDRHEDADAIEYQVEMHAYSNKTEAWKELRGEVMYTIVDFQEQIRGKDNLVFWIYEYKTVAGCWQALVGMMQGDIEISGRSYTKLSIKNKNT